MKDKNKKQLNKDLDEKNADQNNEKGALDSAEESLSESENNNTEEEKTELENQNSKSQDEAESKDMVVINKDVSKDAKWYVVHTYSGHENKVALSLKERVEATGHSDKVFKIFLPHQQKIVVSEGKKRSVNEKLFPGYIVVLMEMNDDSWYIVRSTPGVTGFVGMGSTPTPLPETEVQTLIQFAKMEAPRFEAKFRVGDSVKVNDGPFKDFLGKVDEVNEEQGKVKVLVSVFGRETPLELSFTQVSQL
ncbi:MAG TPA: transcription termination/antitermination protein NusG [bacterium]|jgi:transcriptional antiterminator NusG|nr:transcription termination/antitermination protein NusG [bacterium]HOV97729.1 transcription termination/antitermination protein NusG [bacterium]